MLTTKEILKTILITADIARTDTLRPIFCVSSRLRLSANAFCFLILFNTNEKNNLAAGSSAFAGHHYHLRPPASAAAKFPVVFRTPENYLKDKLCYFLICITCYTWVIFTC